MPGLPQRLPCESSPESDQSHAEAAWAADSCSRHRVWPSYGWPTGAFTGNRSSGPGPGPGQGWIWCCCQRWLPLPLVMTVLAQPDRSEDECTTGRQGVLGQTSPTWRTQLGLQLIASTRCRPRSPGRESGQEEGVTRQTPSTGGQNPLDRVGSPGRGAVERSRASSPSIFTGRGTRRRPSCYRSGLRCSSQSRLLRVVRVWEASGPSTLLWSASSRS